MQFKLMSALFSVPLFVGSYMDMDWSAEEFSGGGYSAVNPFFCSLKIFKEERFKLVGPVPLFVCQVMAPGVMTTLCDVIAEPLGCVHFAGTETATK